MKHFLPLLVFSLILTGCNPFASDKQDDSDILAEENYRLVTGTKDLVDPVHGKRIGFWYGAMSGTEEVPSNGVAYLHVFEDGTSAATLNLNIGLAPSGTTYVVRLQNSVGGSVELGELRSILEDSRHSLTIEIEQDLSDYLTFQVFAVTRSSETLVAEGEIKQPPPGTW